VSDSITVLYARADSVYKEIEGCDVYDIDRDARTWRGGGPVVAHPPCGQWGRLRTFARVDLSAKSLAVLAVGNVRAGGGGMWNTRPEASSGSIADFPCPEASISGAVTQCPCCNSGGATRRRKQLGCTSAVVCRTSCRRFRLSWATRRMLSKRGWRRPDARDCGRVIETRRRRRWRAGWSRLREDAGEAKLRP
jgi:hypothetical protein